MFESSASRCFAPFDEDVTHTGPLSNYETGHCGVNSLSADGSADEGTFADWMPPTRSSGPSTVAATLGSHALEPPSILKLAPVTYEDSSEARYSIR